MAPTEPHRPKRVLVLAVHPVTTAATRLRMMQFAPYTGDKDLDLVLWSFLTDSSVRVLYGPSHLSRVLVTLRSLLRIPLALMEIRRADVVVVQREALPFGPPVLEWLASRRSPVVWDVDDAIWESFPSSSWGRLPRWLRATSRKYASIAGWAAEVWAGSEVLATWCRQHASTVRVVPTVVPVAQKRPHAASSTVVSWIGSHSTGPFVESLLPALHSVQPHPEVVVVGAQVASPPGVDVTNLPWSEQIEGDVLARTRVGLYPIDRTHPLAEGKCGLKAVLYMSKGIPPVVTPTTTNATVVRAGVDGLHAESPDEWRDAVQHLLTDGADWERMSQQAHARALAEYSAQVWGPRVSRWLRALADA